jgi:hypothetical protein
MSAAGDDVTTHQSKLENEPNISVIIHGFMNVEKLP